MGSNTRGVTVAPSKVATWLAHCVKTNLRAIESGRPERKVVPCVWGPAGVAKTSMFKQLEKEGLEIDGEIVYPKVIHVALAQIEESGDLTGLPIVTTNEHGEAITNYAPPEWWPTPQDAIGPDGKTRPVILLIDDFNRADPRILKAIMQLLQDYGTNTRQLPPTTTIGLTGNPPTGDDGTEYMVNEIDKAILTRMNHITMKFDKIDWSLWAEKSDIDKRVISYVLRYPELVDGTKGERTNPRSITQFANLIDCIPNLKEEEELVTHLAMSCLDEDVATSFQKFALGDMQYLVEPEEILNDWKSAEKKLDALKKRGGGNESTQLRADIAGIITDRLYVYIMNPDTVLEKHHFESFRLFIQRTDILPEDGIYALLRRARRDAKTPQQNKMINDMIRHGGKEIADLIMNIS